MDVSKLDDNSIYEVEDEYGTYNLTGRHIKGVYDCYMYHKWYFKILGQDG